MSWLVQAQQAEGLPVEVLLSCLLAADTADIERGWHHLAKSKEDVIAETSEQILSGLVAELDAELGAGWPTKPSTAEADHRV